MAKDETYDISEEPPPPRPPLKPLVQPVGKEAEDAPALPQEAWNADGGDPRPLGYARPGTANTRGRRLPAANTRGAAADPTLLPREHRRTFTIPILLIVLGTLIVFACSWAITGSLVHGARWAALGITWDIVIIALGVFLGASLVDLEAQSIKTIMLQVAAVALASAASFWPIMWLDNGAICGGLIAWITSTLVFCALMSYFFELDMYEVIVLLILITVVRFAGNLVWMHFFGWSGYLPT